MASTCYKCNKTFAYPHGAKKHIETIHGEDLRCPIPGCTFTTKYERTLPIHSANVKLHARLLEELLSQTDIDLKSVLDFLMSYQTPPPVYPSMTNNFPDYIQNGVSHKRIENGNQQLWLQTPSEAPQSYPQAVVTPQSPLQSYRPEAFTPQYPLSTTHVNNNFIHENIHPDSYAISPPSVGGSKAEALWDNGSKGSEICTHGLVALECDLCYLEVA